VEVPALAVPRALLGERSARITSPWAVGAIVAAFYLLLMGPGLIQNPYQFINIGTLPSTDVRTGYPTPTLLWKGKDLFGMPVPKPPYDVPS